MDSFEKLTAFEYSSWEDFKPTDKQRENYRKATANRFDPFKTK